MITVSNLADYDGEPDGLGSPPSNCNAPDLDDDYRYSSNYGSDVDVAAPGTCILSTWKPSTAYRSVVRKKRKGKRRRIRIPYLAYGYNTISGTSMASPHVAGAAALIKSNNPSYTPSQVKSALLDANNTEAVNAGHWGDQWNSSHTSIIANHPEPLMLANNH